MMKDFSAERDLVVSRLQEDLIGPSAEFEELESRPTDVYLTGILWPTNVKMVEEDQGSGGVANLGEESSSSPDEVKTRSLNRPSLAGLSFSASSDKVPCVKVVCSFATYEKHLEKFDDAHKTVSNLDNSSRANPRNKTQRNWIRRPHKVSMVIELSSDRQGSYCLSDYGYEKRGVEINLRCIKIEKAVLVTLTLINSSMPSEKRDEVESSTLFQTSIKVEPCEGTFLVPKPSRKSKDYISFDKETGYKVSDEDSGRLLYRNVSEFAVGHVCSAEFEVDTEERIGYPTARRVNTTWIPSTIVEGMDPNGHHYFREIENKIPQFNPFSAHNLAFAETGTLEKGLNLFCYAYEKWIDEQQARIRDPQDVPSNFVEIASENLKQCRSALKRMLKSIEELRTDEKLRRSFQLANLAMDLQFSWDSTKSNSGLLRWRPFQLGFLLLSVPSTVCREHDHREYMDLLWFPTGGGKTEAYLALIACVAIYRRLSDNENDHFGVCALMRYTLRLLTTQQFSRSSAMIMALEMIRCGRVEVPEGLPIKGNDPFSIGLWVGLASTPNKRTEAFASLMQRSPEVSSPIQLLNCPCCRSKLDWSIASASSPVNVECKNSDCLLFGHLPIYTVDEDVYEIRPTLLIGTIDKFAQIVRRKETNSLFSIHDGSPPDLIIQDELHLISGPLGTIAGAYEAAFDLIFASKCYKTKVIGSTATIRKAPEQVLALFNRQAYQFPPPVIDHDNFGFAVPDKRPEALGRRFLGVSTAGRSAAFTMQAVSGSLLQTADGAFDNDEAKDAYWTLVSYFNSLRELGGALVLMQDVVTGRIRQYAEKREEELRKNRNVEELTSRRSQKEITSMLDVLEFKATQDGAIDVLLATNMLSVGIDISRLGLMLVNSQPKTTAEYIQATSRVGRGKVGGLVVSILNNAKARDRSHYENFTNWHRTLYRDIEATSVTPFASRARDKVLHATLVASVRHLIPEMLDSPIDIEDFVNDALKIIASITKRAKVIDPEETEVSRELKKYLEQWMSWMPDVYWNDGKPRSSLLQSAEQIKAKQRLAYNSNRPWRTLNAMRTVEQSTPFKMIAYLKDKDDA